MDLVYSCVTFEQAMVGTEDQVRCHHETYSAARWPRGGLPPLRWSAAHPGNAAISTDVLRAGRWCAGAHCWNIPGVLPDSQAQGQAFARMKPSSGSNSSLLPLQYVVFDHCIFQRGHRHQ